LIHWMRNGVLDLGILGICKAGADGSNAYIAASVDDNSTYALAAEVGYFLNYNNQYVFGYAGGKKAFDADYHYLSGIEQGASSNVASFTQMQLKGMFKG
jgi:hypothetical protein